MSDDNTLKGTLLKASSSFGSLFGKLTTGASDFFKQTKENFQPHIETAHDKFNENIKPNLNTAVDMVKKQYSNMTKK